MRTKKTSSATWARAACAAAIATAAPVWAQTMHDMAGMDMPAPAASTPAAPMQMQMPAQSMPGMSAPATPAPPPAHQHDMGGMQGMQGGDPASKAPARTADAYSDGYTPTTGPYIPAGVKPPRLADQESFGSVLVDRLERAHASDANWNAYDIQAWFGHDFNRLVVKAEGDAAQGRLQDARTELLWGHAVAPFWDAQLGLRHDNGGGPDRNWLALGMEGLAPYWFDVEATAYLGSAGRTALRLSASYDLLLTQRWVLQPRVEASLYGKDDPERLIGSGLSDINAAIRLRYEITRQFAPYVGIEWSGRFGRSADLSRAAGDQTRTTDLVAGLHFWF